MPDYVTALEATAASAYFDGHDIAIHIVRLPTKYDDEKAESRQRHANLWDRVAAFEASATEDGIMLLARILSKAMEEERARSIPRWKEKPQIMALLQVSGATDVLRASGWTGFDADRLRCDVDPSQPDPRVAPRRLGPCLLFHQATLIFPRTSFYLRPLSF